MIGTEGIKAVLPHRYPMLLVDRVTDLVPGRSITALKAVTANEPWYATTGDGPAATHSYPPALLVESWCQAAGLLAAWDRPNPDVTTGQVMLFGSITGLDFRGRVLPGDVLEHRVRLVKAVTAAAVFEGEALVGPSPVLTVERIVMAMRPADDLVGGACGLSPSGAGRGPR